VEGGGVTDPAQSDLAARVGAELHRTAELLRTGGRADDATALISQYEAPPHARPALFVAGEDKRGKSCLVNALLRRPDLSPVGVEVMTSAPITFCEGAPPWGRVFHYGQRDPVALEFDEARALATVTGNPRNEKNVRAVQLGVESPILEQLNLIDTPGVGGLESGHAALTIQSLRSADALIFVTEAAAQFRAEELSFLRRAAARVETVIIVLTKVDVHRGWRKIMEDDIAILREQAPRFADCPVIPVSALLALRGLAIDDPAEAEEIRAESGLAELERAISKHVVARAATLREANLLRAGHGTLGGVMLGVIQTLRSLDDGGAGRQALEAERARLQTLKQDQAGWPRLLDSEIRKLTLERMEGASRGTVDIKRRFDQRLRDVRKGDQDTLPGELLADLTALAGRLNDEAAERLTVLVDKMMSDLDESAELHRSIGDLTTDRLQDELSGTSLGDYGMTVNDKLSVMSSFSSGRSLASLASVAAGSIVAPPVGLALGLGLGAMFAFSSFMTRDQHAFTAAFQSWMQAQISQAQLTINNTFQRQMMDVQEEIRDTIGKALVEREREITASLKASQELLAAESGKRQTAQAQLQQRLGDLRGTRGQIELLLSELSSADPPTIVPAASGQAEP
jgi:hypothetical protein